MTELSRLRIGFTLRGLDGRIDASLAVDADPDALGLSLLTGASPVDFVRDFPVCRAAVDYPADGYAAVFGWTQMVRSTDSLAQGFEMDPIAIYRDVDTPFAWYGLKPDLFDAPSRESRRDMAWEAHSFLCISPDAVTTPHVQAIAGFRWGFLVTGGRVDAAPLEALGSDAWDGHLGLLRTSYPRWTFDVGFRLDAAS